MAYTYLIGWSKLDKWYYGVRFANNSNPNDLWIKYYTSSNKVKEMRLEHGEPDVVQVRKVFNDSHKARLWETKVIQKIGAVKSDRWLNQTDNTDKFFHEGKRGSFSEDHRKKLSLAKSGKKISKSHAEKLHNGRKNSKNSVEHNEAIRKYALGRKFTEEQKSKISLGIIAAGGTKERASKAGKISSEKYKNDPDRQKRHSDKMKLVWQVRKQKLYGGMVNGN